MKTFSKIFVFASVFMLVSVASFAADQVGQSSSPTDCVQNSNNMAPAQAGGQGQPAPAPAPASASTAK